MKLLCISSAADEKEDEEVQKVANSEPLNGAAKQDQESSQQQQQQKPTKVRSWYNSLRRGLRRKSREPRVTISDPITSVQLTQSELIQINGVIEVKPTGNSPGAGNGDGEGGGDDDHQEEIAAAEDATANGESGDDNKDTVNGRSSKTPPPALPPKPTSPITVGTKIGAVEKVENGNEEEEEEEEDDEEQDDEEEKEETSLDLVGYSWFWGGISRRDAEALLRGRKDGTFLVRNSSDRPRFLYSLSFRSLGKTMHTRIEKSGGRLYFSSTEHAAAYKAAKKRGRRGGEGCQKREEGSRSLGGLISIAMNYGDENIFFYSRSGCQLHPQQGNEDKSSSSSNNNNNGEEVPAPPGQATSTGLSLYTVHLNSPLNRFAYLLDFEYSEGGGGVELRGAEPEQKKALQYLCKFVLHHVPEAKARIQKDGWSPLKVLPLEMQLFAADAQYFPRPVKAA